MKIDVKTVMGGVELIIHIDEQNEKEALHKACVFGNPRTYCELCDNSGRDNFLLISNKDKEGNIYVNTLCKGCGAKSKLGSYKTGGYFWHRFEKWEGNNDRDMGTEMER